MWRWRIWKNTLKNTISNFHRSSWYSEFEFDVEQGLEGGIYPKPGGLMKNLLYHNPELNIMNVEGQDKVYREMIRYMEAGDEYKPTSARCIELWIWM